MRPRVVAWIVLVLVGCRPSDREYATLDAWLLCDDCSNGERAAVQAIGSRLTRTLDQAVRGPTPGRVANKVAQFTQAYASLPSPAVTESAYVATARSNYIARYQQRAALSLGDIGTRRAVQALERAADSAVTREYRDDVVDVIETVLALVRTGPFGGAISPALVRFGDTVIVRRGSGPGWNGNENVLLRGAPIADSVIVTRWGTDSLSFVVAASMGDRAVSITGLGASEDTESVLLHVVAPGYRSHTPASAPVVTAEPFPQVHYLELPSRFGDSTDFFRFEPPTALMVTAHVAGRSGVSLRWFNCSATLFMPGASGSIAGVILDQSGVPLGGATVRREGTLLATTADAFGRFMLPILPPTSIVSLRVTRLGYRTILYRVQTGADSVDLGAVLGTSPYAASVLRQASTVVIPAGACRLLQVGTSGGGAGVRRLVLTSP